MNLSNPMLLLSSLLFGISRVLETVALCCVSRMIGRLVAVLMLTSVDLGFWRP